MKVAVYVCNDTGWHEITGECPEGSDVECYNLPKSKGQPLSRLVYWRKRIGVEIPDGHSVLWEVVI